MFGMRGCLGEFAGVRVRVYEYALYVCMRKCTMWYICVCTYICVCIYTIPFFEHKIWNYLLNYYRWPAWWNCFLSGSLWHSYKHYFFCYSFLFKLIVYPVSKINTTTTILPDSVFNTQQPHYDKQNTSRIIQNHPGNFSESAVLRFDGLLVRIGFISPIFWMWIKLPPQVNGEVFAPIKMSRAPYQIKFTVARSVESIGFYVNQIWETFRQFSRHRPSVIRPNIRPVIIEKSVRPHTEEWRILGTCDNAPADSGFCLPSNRAWIFPQFIERLDDQDVQIQIYSTVFQQDLQPIHVGTRCPEFGPFQLLFKQKFRRLPFNNLWYIDSNLCYTARGRTGANSTYTWTENATCNLLWLLPINPTDTCCHLANASFQTNLYSIFIN